MKIPTGTKHRKIDFAYLALSIILVGIGYAAYRGLYFIGEGIPFAQEMVLVFLGAAATIYLTAVLLNRQTELELKKEGQVLLFQQKHEIYMSAIEQVAEIVEREQHDPELINELRVLNHKLAVVGSTGVVQTFRKVLDMLATGLREGALNDNDAEQVMHAVAEVTIAMRLDMIGDAKPIDIESSQEVILSNSRQIEQLDDIEYIIGKSGTKSARPKR